jgi:hypothetical protein
MFSNHPLFVLHALLYSSTFLAWVDSVFHCSHFNSTPPRHVFLDAKSPNFPMASAQLLLPKFTHTVLLTPSCVWLKPALLLAVLAPALRIVALKQIKHPRGRRALPQLNRRDLIFHTQNFSRWT